VGSALYFLGRYEGAQDRYREALALYTELGDEQGAGRCVLNLANVADRQGDFTGARELYERSLSMSRAIGDRWGEAASLNNLGNILLAQGEFRPARALYAESLAMKRDLGHQEGVAASLDNLGRAAYGLGEWGEARRLRAGSLAIRREIGDAWGIANSLTGLGDIALAQSDFVAARAAYLESLRTAIGIEVPMLVEAALVGWAEMLGREGETERALTVLAAVRSRGGKDRLTQARAESAWQTMAAEADAGTVRRAEAASETDLAAIAVSVLADEDRSAGISERDA
jgi:tetratricopeptide (TPR) repeat protein